MAESKTSTAKKAVKKAVKKAPTKKAPAKKAPAKKAAAKAPAKKTAAKKAPAKKISLKLGDTVVVNVDPRQNNGSSEAPAQVTRVLNTPDARVNVRVTLDNEDQLFCRNVPVLDKAPADNDEDAPAVYALLP